MGWPFNVSLEPVVKTVLKKTTTMTTTILTNRVGESRATRKLVSQKDRLTHHHWEFNALMYLVYV